MIDAGRKVDISNEGINTWYDACMDCEDFINEQVFAPSDIEPVHSVFPGSFNMMIKLFILEYTAKKNTIEQLEKEVEELNSEIERLKSKN